MMRCVRDTTPEIEKAARRMRQALTPAERTLWEALRERRLAGPRFRCQHPVGRFILDFYCPAHRLVIEVDGGVHDDQIEYDEARATVLHGYGYRVLRFRNEKITSELPAVLARITAEVGVHDNC